MARDTSEELNLRHICWKDDAWLGYHGMLSTITALSYFSYSPFYDGQPVAPSRPIQKLNAPNNREYVLQDAQPPHLFVIRQQLKTSTGELPTSAFYILDGTIYQSPPLHSLCESKMDKCAYKILKCLELLRDDLDPVTGTLETQKEEEEQMALKLKALEAGQLKTFADSMQQVEKADQIAAVVMHKYLPPVPESSK